MPLLRASGAPRALCSPRRAAPLLALACAAWLAGCGQALKVRTPPAQARVPDAFSAPAAQAADGPQQDLGRWWRLWGDARMNALIERALAASPDIRAAQANLQAARALADVAESALYPTAVAAAAAGAGTADWRNASAWRTLAPPYSAALPSSADARGLAAGVGAVWEADVFGARRADASAARAAAAIAQERLHGAHMLVAAEAASNWREALALAQRLSILDAATATAAQLHGYAQARLAAGQARAADVAAAQARLAGLQAARPALQALLLTRRQRLAALCGQPPGQPDAALAALLPDVPEAPETPNASAAASEAAAPPEPSAPPAPPSGQLPSSVLARRPDVRVRQQAVQARAAQLKSLKAELLPSFGIVFLGNEGRLDFSGLPRASGAGGLIGLRVSLPLFTAGRLQAQARAGDARLHAAVAEYDRAVLDALQEVEAAYAARAALDARVESLRAARQSAARRASGLQALYQAGERQRDAPLQARLELAEADDALAQARMQQASASIRLYQALGGGW
ncbi:TolC family protein [Ottowia sp. oral taxon 894]|uniref:TolC family protein n=1 Tax=Ottowia sp. oral taxon 894 TaxID=1658672 RepID=UPI00155D9277|nr:TolC family protein [Ottowia sp. oral taxon 894]